MNRSKLLVITITLFSTLVIYACVPGPHRGPGMPRLSANEAFANADLNGDNMLTFEEFESALPQ